MNPSNNDHWVGIVQVEGTKAFQGLLSTAMEVMGSQVEVLELRVQTLWAKGAAGCPCLTDQCPCEGSAARPAAPVTEDPLQGNGCPWSRNLFGSPPQVFPTRWSVLLGFFSNFFVTFGLYNSYLQGLWE